MCLQLFWHCWLGIRKSIWPVKNRVMRCWCGYLSGVRCSLFAYCLANASASQNPSSLASFKSRLVLHFWYWLTEAVLEKRPFNGYSSSSSVGCVAAGLCIHTKRPDSPAEQPAAADLPARLVQAHSVPPGAAHLLLETLWHQQGDVRRPWSVYWWEWLWIVVFVYPIQ